MFQQMAAQMGAVLGGGGEADEVAGTGIGMEVMRFMMDMPLVSVLHFQDQLLPISPEEMVDGMLEQVYAAK